MAHAKSMVQGIPKIQIRTITRGGEPPHNKDTKMEAIDKTLKWAQLLQTSCFGTPVGLAIQPETNDGCRAFQATLYITGNNEMKVIEYYTFSAESSTTLLYQTWGKMKADTNNLLSKHTGKKLNRHGREKAAE